MNNLPTLVIAWNEVKSSTIPGASGLATSKAQSGGDIRIRLVEYSPGYEADHWCSKGHIIHCLEGAIEVELDDGARLVVSSGDSFQIGDDGPAHRAFCKGGAKLLIVD